MQQQAKQTHNKAIKGDNHGLIANLEIIAIVGVEKSDHSRGLDYVPGSLIN